MFEVKVTIVAPELTQAINNLAAAVAGTPPTQGQPQPAPQPAPGPIANPTPSPAAPGAPAGAAQSGIVPGAAMTGPTAGHSNQTGVPVAGAPQYTLDQIMKAGGTLMDAGRVNELTGLLANFGVRALTELNPAQYGAFATALRGMGAAI